MKGIISSEQMSEETRIMLNELVQETLQELIKEVSSGNMTQTNKIIMLRDVIGYSTPKLSASMSKQETNVIGQGDTAEAINKFLKEATKE